MFLIRELLPQVNEVPPHTGPKAHHGDGFIHGHGLISFWLCWKYPGRLAAVVCLPLMWNASFLSLGRTRRLC